MQTQDKARRARRGDGSLFKRPLKSGGEVWIGKFAIDGRNVMRSVGPVKSKHHPNGLTDRKAQQEFGKLREQARLSPERDKATKTLRDAADGLLKQKRSEGRKPATIEAIDCSARIHIVPFFHGPVRKITDEQVAHFRDHLIEDKGLAPKSAANIMGTLHGLFNYAIRQKWMPNENPVKGVKAPKSNAALDFNYLTPEQVDALLRAVPDTAVGRVDRAMYLMAARTGLRQGELLALRWCDIEWSRSIVHVRRNYVRTQFQSPKSGKGRSVPLTPQLLRELELLHQGSRWQDDDDLVFAHPDTGKPMERSRLLKRFKAAVLGARVGRFEPVLDAAGKQKRKPVVDPHTNRWVRDENGEPVTEPVERPLLRFHDLRHTFGTQLASEGIAMRKIQEWMGHAEFQTTLIYSHFMPGAEDAAKIAAAFGETRLAEPNEIGTPEIPISDVAAKLRILAESHSAGLLDADEFAAKAALLAAA